MNKIDFWSARAIDVCILLAISSCATQQSAPEGRFKSRSPSLDRERLADFSPNDEEAESESEVDSEEEAENDKSRNPIADTEAESKLGSILQTISESRNEDTQDDKVAAEIDSENPDEGSPKIIPILTTAPKPKPQPMPDPKPKPMPMPMPKDDTSVRLNLASFNLWENNVTTINNKAKVIGDTLNADVVCLQEIPGKGDDLKHFLYKYPYQKKATNKTTKKIIFGLGPTKYNSIGLVSKYEIVSSASKVIQTDPSVDKWTRNAIFARIKVREKLIDIFCYHNTHNFDKENGKYELSGNRKLREWIESGSKWQQGYTVVMGDFNYAPGLDTIFPSTQVANPNRIDQIRGNQQTKLENQRVKDLKYGKDSISDHWAVTADLVLK